ncbi:respiratory nitrate reductase subunit gamma [Thermodesulfobacteriota bacterium]
MAAGVIASVVLWTKGKARSLHHAVNVPAIIRALIVDCVLQLQILKISFVRWVMHFCIFVGFMGLLAQTSLMAIMSHFLPADSFLSQTFFNGGGSRVLDVWGDVFGVMLVAGLLIAIVRRYITRAKQLETILKDTLSILFLTIIALSGFLAEAFRLMDPQYADIAWFSFAGYAFTKVLLAVGIGAMDYHVWVWIHALVSLVFIAYIPFSKAWHIFVSPIEIVLDASERA